MRKIFCDKCKKEKSFIKKIYVSTGDGEAEIVKEFCPECHKVVWGTIHGAMYDED